MKKEKLKSTTVRLTDSDLQLIERLQQKLGLGMIHVVRRLAENENLLSIARRPKKVRFSPIGRTANATSQTFFVES